jgi:hypothetical protein
MPAKCPICLQAWSQRLPRWGLISDVSEDSIIDVFVGVGTLRLELLPKHQGPELLNKYVGEIKQHIHFIFAMAVPGEANFWGEAKRQRYLTISLFHRRVAAVRGSSQ